MLLQAAERSGSKEIRSDREPGENHDYWAELLPRLGLCLFVVLFNHESLHSYLRKITKQHKPTKGILHSRLQPYPINSSLIVLVSVICINSYFIPCQLIRSL
jgi:hypothetical protein